MGHIVSLVEYRKKRCLEAFMLKIGIPAYCQECGDDIEALLLADAPPIGADVVPTHQTPATIYSLFDTRQSAPLRARKQ
jgi:hypothetical protein